MTNIELETLTAVKTACREFIRKDEIDWEQRRYELVKDFMAAVISGGHLDMMHKVYDWADAVIIDLKEDIEHGKL